MYQHVLNFIGVGILSAILAVATIIGNAMRIDKDPAVDGPRALVAEFIGLWIAFACLAWSFMMAGPERLQWILRGLAACVAILAFSLAAYFAGTPEVDTRLDQEPTGFEVPMIALQLHNLESPSSENATATVIGPTNEPGASWSELNPQDQDLPLARGQNPS